jgi:hypothetical protein
MSATVPLSEPTKLRAGFTWSWRREDLAADYPAGTWSLNYAFKNAANHFEITAVADGDNFAVTVAAATNASYAAGKYNWAAWVESGAEKHEAGEGWIEIEAAFTGATAFDTRSHARKVLDAIEAEIEGKATAAQIAMVEYTIGSRHYKRDPKILMDWHNKYLAIVAAETRADDVAAGRRPRQLSARL